MLQWSRKNTFFSDFNEVSVHMFSSGSEGELLVRNLESYQFFVIRFYAMLN